MNDEQEAHARDLTRMWERAQREHKRMTVVAALADGSRVGGYVTGHGSLWSIQSLERGLVEDIRPEWIVYAQLSHEAPTIPQPEPSGDHEYIAGLLGNVSADDVAAFVTAYSRVTGDWGGADDDRYEALAHLLRLANTIGRRQANPVADYLD